MGSSAAFEGISGALDIAGGIASYFASAYSQSIASSQASMIQATAQANEARYALQAKALEATQSTDYAASGVKATGSPIDVIDQTQQIAQQNEAQILMAGQEQAQGELNQGDQAAMQGRMALLGGVVGGIAGVAQGVNLSSSGGGTGGGNSMPPASSSNGGQLDLGGGSSFGYTSSFGGWMQ